MRRSVPLILIVCLLIAASAAASDEPCAPGQVADDPAGDQSLDLAPAQDTSPADLLRINMTSTWGGLAFEVELGGDPREAAPMAYSYWVSFQDGGRSPGGNAPTWTFQRTTTYDNISTMYWETPADLPVVWDDTTFSFVVPWEAFDAAYGNSSWGEFGSPRASSSGPYLAASGANNPSQDFIEYNATLVPIATCPAPEVDHEAPDPPSPGMDGEPEAAGPSEDAPDSTTVDAPGSDASTPGLPLLLATGAMLLVAQRKRRAQVQVRRQ